MSDRYVTMTVEAYTQWQTELQAWQETAKKEREAREKAEELIERYRIVFGALQNLEEYATHRGVMNAPQERQG